MIVMKFGGTSIGDAERIEQVVNIVRLHLDKRPIVVVSAIAGVTDLLIEAAEKAQQGKNTAASIEKKHSRLLEELGLPKELIHEEISELNHLLSGVALLRELTPRTLAAVASFGERMSAKIVAAKAAQMGIAARAYNAHDLGFVTNNNYDEAEILPQTYENLRRSIALIPEKTVPVITGYIAKNGEGEITTLGRGGSDYTAAIIGSAVAADEIQIWTDVPGMMTTDPKIVSAAETVDVLSFDEATELAYFGAKILHPKTILPAMQANIPVRVLNTYNPSDKGTTILRHTPGRGKNVTAIACKKNLTIINIHSERMLFAYGFLDRVFRLFSSLRIPVDMISTSEVSISLTVDSKHDVHPLLERLREFSEVTVEKGQASICVVGSAIGRTPNIAGRIFSAMGNAGINIEMITQGASEINVGMVVKEEDAHRAIQALHQEFFGSEGGGSDETGRVLHRDGDAVQRGQES